MYEADAANVLVSPALIEALHPGLCRGSMKLRKHSGPAMVKKPTAGAVTRSEFTKLRKEVATLTATVQQLAVALQAVDTMARGNFRRCAEVQAALDRLMKTLEQP
jgi:hypothetical protein